MKHQQPGWKFRPVYPPTVLCAALYAAGVRPLSAAAARRAADAL